MSDIGGRTIDGFLAQLASDAPTPGGGAVAGLAAANGAALIEMVCNLTIGKAGYEEVDERMRSIVAEAEAARAALLEVADRDATAFDGVMAAFKMPKETDAQKAERSQAIQRGYEAAAVVPLECAKQASTLMELAVEVTRIGNAQTASDGSSAAQCLSAAVWCATYNVEINAAALKDQAKAQALRDEVSALRASTQALLDAANAAFAERLT
jgi:formiminotetrahydrofolate cyclodeaminase